MSPEAQRIAIAEACGFTRIRAIPIVIGGEHHGDVWKAEVDGWEKDLPDYLSDLNAMHEAEKMLDADQLDMFCERLFLIITNGGRAPYHWPSVVVHTGPAPRAEAFLRTIGKWRGPAQ